MLKKPEVIKLLINGGRGNTATLHIVKQGLNVLLPRFIQLVPSREPTIPINKVLNRVKNRVYETIDRENAQYKYKDGNFPTFLDSVWKTLLYMVEDDGHYRVILTATVEYIADELIREWLEFNKEYVKQNPDATMEDSRLAFHYYLCTDTTDETMPPCEHEAEIIRRKD